MSRPDRTRTRARTRLYLVGVLPALLMLLVSGRITLLLLEESSGLSAYGAEQNDAARADFAANQVLNPFEPWIAHFDEGTARHRGGDLDGAVTAYEAALDEDVPAEWECAVRNNLALAYEGLGDTALEEQGRVTAEEQWLIARDVLSGCLDNDESSDERKAGDAPGDGDPADADADGGSDRAVRARESSVVIDARLAAKLEGRDPVGAPPASDPPPPAESLEERERRLRERDRRALEQHRLQEQRRAARQDSQDDPASEAPPVPPW